MTSQLDSKINRISSYGMDLFIGRRTVRVIDLTDVTNAGSGVTIKIDDHYFVATAAHVIKENHDYCIPIAGSRTAETCSDFA